MTATDLNVQFREEKQGQVAQARAIVERNRASIEKYDSGQAQAELDARLASQVADGTIRMISPDRYEVLTGWDANEIFTVRRATRPTEIPLILPETGLDFVDGHAQLYLAQPAWHELGTIIGGGTSDIQEVIDASGGGYFVSKRAARFYGGGKMRTDEDHWHNVREDTWESLGVVGRIYQPVQNIDAVSFLGELTGSDDLIIESAGPLRGGRKFFVSARLPEDVVIDAEGVNEIIRPYVVAINSFDGTTPFQVVCTPWCPVCGNTERFAVRDAHSRWTVRHTTNALQKIEEARKTLGLSVKYYDRFEVEENQLARITLELDEFDKLIGGLWTLDDDASDLQKRRSAERRDQLVAGYQAEATRSGKTARSGEFAITQWLDNVAPRKALKDDGGAADPMAAARATLALEGADDDLKSKAHRRLLKLAA